ncbi:MAG: redoxin domain-containing protein [Acidobacteriota bacterium]
MNTSKKSMDLQAPVQAGSFFRKPSSLRLGVGGFFLVSVLTLLLVIVIPETVRAQDEFNTLYDKACLCFRQAQYDEALKYYKKANRLKDDASLECLWGMAQTYSNLGAYKNTLKTCDRLIEASGDNLYYLVKAWNMKGNELSAAAGEKSGDLDVKKLLDAESAYREVLRLSGVNMGHYNLGITLIRLDRIDEGVHELQIFLKEAEDEELAEKAGKIIEDPRRAVENFAPDFSFVTSDGEYISTDELRGKVVMIDFWGAWCGPCRDAVSFLSKLAKKYREDPFVLISVDENDEESKWRDFIAENEMTWTQTRDSNRKIQSLFDVRAFPTYILIDHEGIIRYKGIGSNWQTEDDIKDSVKKALKAREAYQDKQEKNPEPTVPKLAAKHAVELKLVSRLNSTSSGEPASSLTKVDQKAIYSFRIPKPSVEVIRTENPNMPSGIGNRNTFYRLSVLNWASIPDDLFETSKDLMACSSQAIRPLNTEPRRLEIVINSEDGRVLRAFCDPPQQQVLRSLMFTIPNQIETGRIYITLKDRLTGKSVRSDMVALP